MKTFQNRREFLRTAGVLGSALAFAPRLFSASRPSILLFTKSSGYEHAVIKNTDGKPSVVEQALRRLGAQRGFDVTATKDGRIFDSNDFRSHGALFFYTTGDLTKPGTDGNPPMSERGKQALLDAVRGGLGFVGAHAASDTFHPPADASASGADSSGSTSGPGGQSDPYLQMLGGEFLAHGKIQPANLIVNDAKFPGVKTPPRDFSEEWYSLKHLVPDMHVILTVDTAGMEGGPYQRPPYPVTWARRHGKGRVFYTAMGHLPETWENDFFLSLVAGGIAWAMGEAKAKVNADVAKVDAGYAQVPELTKK
ncbi:MAG TPA: ThuA domain-containing protein [Terriglobales bacterium]